MSAIWQTRRTPTPSRNPLRPPPRATKLDQHDAVARKIFNHLLHQYLNSTRIAAHLPMTDHQIHNAFVKFFDDGLIRVRGDDPAPHGQFDPKAHTWLEVFDFDTQKYRRL